MSIDLYKIVDLARGKDNISLDYYFFFFAKFGVIQLSPPYFKIGIFVGDGAGGLLKENSLYENRGIDK